MIQTTKVRPTIKASALKPGDRVALVCPGSRPATPAVVQRCRRVLEDMQFEVLVGAHVLSISGFMAGTDKQRLEDINGFITDQSIAAIFFITGGFGALHLVQDLDYSAIVRHPKIFIGCDDNTIVLNAVYARTGLITLHGPNIEQVRNRSTFELLKNAVTSTNPLPELSAAGRNDTDDVYGGEFFCSVPGEVEGRLVGGNLTALTSLLGTDYEPIMRNSILFLEDLNEQNGILDRWFTSLYLAGHLQSVKAVALGSFENCNPRGAKNMLSVMDMFADRLQYLAKPSCFGFPFGQTSNTAVVPIGAKASMHCQSGLLRLLEGALAP